MYTQSFGEVMRARSTSLTLMHAVAPLPDIILYLDATPPYGSSGLGGLPASGRASNFTCFWVLGVSVDVAASS